jgi:hypothetical protein
MARRLLRSETGRHVPLVRPAGESSAQAASAVGTSGEPERPRRSPSGQPGFRRAPAAELTAPARHTPRWALRRTRVGRRPAIHGQGHLRHVSHSHSKYRALRHSRPRGVSPSFCGRDRCQQRPVVCGAAGGHRCKRFVELHWYCRYRHAWSRISPCSEAHFARFRATLLLGHAGGERC